MEKSIVKLIKAAVLHHGSTTDMHNVVYPRAWELELRLGIAGIRDGFEHPLERNETPLDRARSLSWLHLLAAVPILMAHVSADKDAMEWTAAVRTANIALALLEHGSRRWEALLEKHGLSLWDYELVVRMHQSMIIFLMPAKLPAVWTLFNPTFEANIERIYSVQPTNNWNLMFRASFRRDKRNMCQVLRKAVEVADESGDDNISICLRWLLCQNILQGDEGASFPLAEVLSMVRKARAAMDQAESWTNPKTLSFLPDIKWSCLGVAARYKAVIEEDPSFVHRMLKAYASLADLESEKRHIMCAFCDEMCYSLKRCAGCKSVGYCSKKCQVKDWKAGHKHECKQHSGPGD
ncbi:hypothetical protein COCOBI_15-1290 [Coccomyxa sp. Obi]|nr:hypothetical protein COCOBI_15-1290 [Coccomyxa sp. Obi]